LAQRQALVSNAGDASDDEAGSSLIHRLLSTAGCDATAGAAGSTVR